MCVMWKHNLVSLISKRIRLPDDVIVVEIEREVISVSTELGVLRDDLLSEVDCPPVVLKLCCQLVKDTVNINQAGGEVQRLEKTPRHKLSGETTTQTQGPRLALFPG